MSSDFNEENNSANQEVLFGICKEDNLKTADSKVNYLENKSLHRAVAYFRHTLGENVTIQELANLCNDFNSLYLILEPPKGTVVHNLPLSIKGLKNVADLFSQLGLSHKLNFIDLGFNDLLDLELSKALLFLKMKKGFVDKFSNISDDENYELISLYQSLDNICSNENMTSKFPNLTLRKMQALLQKKNHSFINQLNKTPHLKNKRSKVLYKKLEIEV
jgi:hypothetical protein